MNFSTILTTLMLTTALTACGGGGGGHGNIPNTTLPDITSSNAEVTSMSNERFSNINKAREIVEDANNQSSTSQISTLNLRTLAAKSSLSDEQIFEEFENMKGYFVDNYGNSTVTDSELKKYLILAGYDLDDINLSHIEGNSESEKLNRWVEINIIQIQKKAQHRYNMYGTKHDIGLENAKLNVVNIDAKQDSYISFTLDKNGKIEQLHFEVDTNSADARYMTLNRKSSKEFTRQGAMLVYGVKLTDSIDIRLELFENPNNIGTLKKMLIAALYEEKEQGRFDNDANITDVNKFMEDSIQKINSLILDDFNKTEDTANVGEAFKEGANTTTKVTYESYTKKNGAKKLQYSDFGTVYVDSMEGNETVNETFVFAGGFDAKRISKNDLQGRMEFEGDAVATVIYQDERDDTRVEHTQSFDGEAELVFDNGVETLSTEFKKWYDVEVTSNANKDNYNITFTNSDNDIDSQYKFNDNKVYNITNFVGDNGNGSYGAVDIGYYGDNGKPEEATGYVAYGENLSDGVDLHAQIGFGTKIDKD